MKQLPKIDPADVAAITFRRVERDCGVNTNIRRDSNQPKPRGLIYDFEVTINGEFRATWLRGYSSAGYTLADSRRRTLYLPPRDKSDHYRVEIGAARQDAFDEVTRAHLHLIPTIEEQTERDRLIAANAADTEYVQQMQARAWNIEHAAVDLYNALRVMVDAYWAKNADGTEGDGGPPPAVVQAARAALALADGKRKSTYHAPKSLILPSHRKVDIKNDSFDLYDFTRNGERLDHHASSVDGTTLRVIVRDLIERVS